MDFNRSSTSFWLLSSCSYIPDNVVAASSGLDVICNRWTEDFLATRRFQFGAHFGTTTVSHAAFAYPGPLRIRYCWLFGIWVSLTPSCLMKGIFQPHLFSFHHVVQLPQVIYSHVAIVRFPIRLNNHDSLAWLDGAEVSVSGWGSGSPRFQSHPRLTSIMFTLPDKSTGE